MRICNECEQPLTEPEITQLTDDGIYEISRQCKNCGIYYSEKYDAGDGKEEVNIRDMIYTLRAADLSSRDEAMYLIDGMLEILGKTQDALADIGDLLDVYEVEFVL